MSGFHAERIRSVHDFLAETEQLRAASPVLTNVIGSIATNVATGLRTYDELFWFVVRDGSGAVVGCASRNAPHNLVLSPMTTSQASVLGTYLADLDPELTGVNGPRETVEAFLEGLASDRHASVLFNEYVHVLGTFVPPPAVPGRPRRARDDELETLVRWQHDFGRDAGLPMLDVEAGVRTRLAARALWWWEVDGEPVSLAGHAPLVNALGGVVGRIGPVYTPQRHRRRGFGAAVTGAVVEQLLPRCTTVMLYADAANSTSNGVYTRLGFRSVGEVVEIVLG